MFLDSVIFENIDINLLQKPNLEFDYNFSQIYFFILRNNFY